MPALVSSQAVSRAPCRSGRVSSTQILIRFPASAAARMTPMAVPYPAVASPPALQWVRMRAGFGTNAWPCRPIAWLMRMSSSRIVSDSAVRRVWISATGRSRDCRATPSIRRIAQARLTAVGRVRMSWSPTRSRAAQNAAWSVSRIVRAPRASPMAAAIPMAGAPRTCRVRMAWATSSTVPHSR